MTPTHSTVYLVDVDNTLIDNDAIQQDLKAHLEQAYGLDSRVRYWKILEQLFAEASSILRLLVYSSERRLRASAVVITGRACAATPPRPKGGCRP
jgi:hypothetical protein